MPREDMIQVRRGTTAEWAAANPVLADGELGWDENLDVLKVGDGTSVWSALAAITGAGGTTGPVGPQGPTGPQGSAGPQGNPGVGVPTGGAVDEVLVKTTTGNFVTGWARRLKAWADQVTLPNSATQFLRVDIPDDLSPTAGWPDRMAWFFNGVRTGYFNEYGEVRARPGKAVTVAFRAFSFASAPSTGNFFELTRGNGAGDTLVGVSETAFTTTLPITSPSIGAKVIVLATGAPVPPGTPAGTVIVRT